MLYLLHSSNEPALFIMVKETSSLRYVMTMLIENGFEYCLGSGDKEFEKYEDIYYLEQPVDLFQSIYTDIELDELIANNKLKVDSDHEYQWFIGRRKYSPPIFVWTKNREYYCDTQSILNYLTMQDNSRPPEHNFELQRIRYDDFISFEPVRNSVPVLKDFH